MFRPGAGTCDGPPFQKTTSACTAYMRKSCSDDSALQHSAMMCERTTSILRANVTGRSLGHP